MTPKPEHFYTFETRVVGLPTGQEGPASLVEFLRYESVNFAVSKKVEF